MQITSLNVKNVKLDLILSIKIYPFEVYATLSLFDIINKVKLDLRGVENVQKEGMPIQQEM